MRCRSSSSSRRCVRIISGPSVAIVNATPWSTKARKVSRTSSSPAKARVSRFEVGQISRTISASLSAFIRSGSRAASIPWPMRSGRRSITSASSAAAWSTPSSPTWIVIPRPADRASSIRGGAGVATPFPAEWYRDPGPCRRPPRDQRLELAIRVPLAARPRAGDVDPDDPARGIPDSPLDDDRVLALVEGAVHHQDQPGADLRVLQARAVEAAGGGHDDVVEVALAAAVSLHRVEAKLECRDPLRAVGAADRAVHRALDGHRARLDQLGPVVDLVEGVE